MAVSSFCRSCGDHFRIQKGIAIANPGIKVSGIAEIKKYGQASASLPFEWAKGKENGDQKETDISEESWVANSENNGGKPQPIPEQGENQDEPVGISAGAFFGLVDESELKEETAGDGESIGSEARGADTLAEGSMEALIGDQHPAEEPGKEKMPPNYVPPEKRKKASDAGSHFEVRCFRCYHIQSVSRFAKSTQCERCSVYISLANYEVKAPLSHSLRTRGDIVIGKRGSLKNCEIACHHLVANGTVEAQVDCSGDATFRKSGVVRGHVFCRRLLIDKHCEVEFPDGVKAQRADINGTLKGDLTCSGNVKVSKTGSIEGDVEAVDIAIKDGGSVTGEMNINPDTTTELPVKVGTNPSIIG